MGKERVLVTGGTGVTGNALVRYLLSLGYSVTAVIRPGSRRRRLLPDHPALDTVECPLGAYQQLAQTLPTDYAAFFHLAWDGGYGKERADLRNHMPMQLENAAHVLEAVEACHLLRCPVFLTVGSQAEYGGGEGVVREDTPCRPENGYGAAKVCARSMSEVLCRQYGIRFLWARLFSVYGPRDGMYSLMDTAIACLLSGREPQYSTGEQSWNYLYSMDAAKALALLAFTPSAQGVYCVAARESRPLKEYIREIHTVVAPGSLPRLGGLGSGKSTARMEIDTTRLVRDTGFCEDYTFRQGIEAVRDWYLASGEGSANQELL